MFINIQEVKEENNLSYLWRKLLLFLRTNTAIYTRSVSSWMGSAGTSHQEIFCWSVCTCCKHSVQTLCQELLWLQSPPVLSGNIPPRWAVATQGNGYSCHSRQWWKRIFSQEFLFPQLLVWSVWYLKQISLGMWHSGTELESSLGEPLGHFYIFNAFPSVCFAIFFFHPDSLFLLHFNIH